METRDVIVVGAGIVGLSAARALAGAGVRVLVVDRRQPASEASAAAAGMLVPQSEAAGETPLFDLGLRARDRHLGLAPELEEETGISVDLSSLGVIDVAFTEEEEEDLRRRSEWQRARGLAVEALGAEDVREAEPNLNPGIRCGVLFPRDRRVDNVRLTRALAASAVARGAALLCGRPVTALRIEGGRVAGVRTGAEAFSAPVVINAMGAWAGLLGGDPQPPPVEPVRGQIVAFEMAPPIMRHVVSSARGYLVPRSDGRTLAGSTLEKAGFDKSVTAGALRVVLDIALELVPKLAEVRIADTWAGLRPGTPDGWPILGPGALPGLFHAVGLYRSGILLGPLVGEIVAGLALGRPPDIDLAPFSPRRFAP